MLRRSARPVASGSGAGVLCHRQRLTGERGFGGLQRGRLDQPRLRADRIPRRQQQQVAGHQVARGWLFAAVAEHAHLRRRQPAQRRHRGSARPSW